jgi:glycosyltransferase involved in cell wall biosynthesis
VSPAAQGRADAPARPVAAVIIPAHNEAAVLGRTLQPLAGAIARGELEVTVVCNACTDATPSVAARFDGVRVLECDIPSKSNALNLGDDATSIWPRIYLDADIVAPPASLAAAAAVLRESVALAARPPAAFDVAGAGPLVRAYYRARGRIPAVRTALWGAGVYGLSAAGHRRIPRFPDVIGDDLLVDRMFRADEKLVVEGEPVLVRVPRTLRALVAITRRNLTGAREPGPDGIAGRGSRDVLAELVGTIRTPATAFDAAVYIAVALLARATLPGRHRRWERDDTSRS